MRRGGVGLVAVVLALAGCKSTDPKPAAKDKDREPPGTAASRTKVKGPAWLEEMSKSPVAGTGVPKADSWAHPSDPNFNVAGEVKGVLAGRVINPVGRGAKGVYIRIEPADAGPADRKGGEVGIVTDANGYFMAKGLRPNTAYDLTADARQEGKPLRGVKQARTPNSNLTIQLRDDVTPVPPPGAAPPGSPPPAEALPPPTDLTGGMPPPGVPTAPRPNDGSWSPGGPATQPVPGPAAPAPTPDPPAPKPENTATGPNNPFRPPPASIPGPPPVPPLPSLPNPAVPPLPPAGAGDNRMSRSVRPAADFALVDTMDRPWNFATGRREPVVLVEFMTTTCVPCKQVIPVLNELQSRYGAGGLQVIGVACDEVPARDRAARAADHRDHNLNYSVFVEPGSAPGAVRDKFGVESYPTAVLLDEGGTVVWRGHPWNDRAALEAAIGRALRR